MFRFPRAATRARGGRGTRHRWDHSVCLSCTRAFIYKKAVVVPCHLGTNNVILEESFRSGYTALTKSSDDLHNNRPHLRAMGPLRLIYVPYAE